MKNYVLSKIKIFTKPSTNPKKYYKRRKWNNGKQVIERGKEEFCAMKEQFVFHVYIWNQFLFINKTWFTATVNQNILGIIMFLTPKVVKLISICIIIFSIMFKKCCVNYLLGSNKMVLWIFVSKFCFLIEFLYFFKNFKLCYK